MLGKAFCYLALIQSKQIFKDGGATVEQVVQHLLNLPRRKSYLPLLCMNAVCQIIAEVRGGFVNSNGFKWWA